MTPASLGGTVIRALIAGVVAALLVAFFHFVVTEPVIEQAIALEEQMEPAMPEAPLVSRDMQRGGLFLGYLIFGLTWAVLLGGGFYLAQRVLPGRGLAQRGMLLALAAYWSIALIPFLKYPANPPGVGDPGTIAFRQSLYVACLAFSVLAVVVALVVGRQVAARSSPTRGWLAGLITLVLGSALVYLLLPPNPDAINLPIGLVANFRVLSLIGLTLFWAVFAMLFGLLLRPGGQPLARPQLSPTP